ncbi:conserved hypothetical protein [Hyella patelloides LEGE 07179]|uniref:Glycosyl hydrolase family 32 N-terminal domain-containing protein n=1 Tax=Hyella patelloides LEGE 07179 TaxID=945734 RepID=A0A563VIK7_9CYAN|nr:hypothetical protein [Hyella patelloides]VEP11254.1 conserved hypothetical protein [Hyella patelloides LEGE 07179]
MKGVNNNWEKLGRILAPNSKIEWMSTFTGASYAVATEQEYLFDVYVTGRDSSNRSLIGRVQLDLQDDPKVINIDPQPVLSCGTLGAFDENGVSYPCLVKHQDKLRLYYTGWMPTVLTPFQNHLGMAVQQGDIFQRFSRAPILQRTNEDFLSIGSVCVQFDEGIWKLWYTSFINWGNEPDAAKHRYIIKYATSEDGINWIRDNQVCIDIQNKEEHSICRPTIFKYQNLYHMWYCYRGDYYKLGYAFSEDGINWTRSDRDIRITLSDTGWDSQSQCYPNVFRCGEYLYLLYCGNEYGREGLGLARLKI